MRQKGLNILTPPPSVTWWEMLIEKYKDPIIIILIIACIANLVINLVQSEPLWDTLAILVAILVTTLVAWWQDMSSKKQFDELNKVSDDELIKVKQEDQVIEVPKSDLMVGDVVLINAGDEVPADLKLVKAVELHCDEAAMTGESEPVIKHAFNINDIYAETTIPQYQVLRGTNITEGSGIGEVIAVGDNTKIGQTTRQAREITDDKTPLTIQLEKLADKISTVSYIIAIILLAFLNSHLFFFTDYSFEWNTFISKELGFIMTAIVIIIAAVPEGLALSVVLALTYSVKAMMKDNNLVKKMKATETVGAVDIIFSDKTGTLTQNKMTVVDSDIKDYEAVFINGSINSTANITDDKVIGNPTEGAILKWINDIGSCGYVDFRKNYPVESQKPFNSTDKYMMSVANNVEWYKGAPEVIANICGDDSFLSLIVEQQARGRRAISFASKSVTGWHYDGSVFIEDPVREDVPNAVKQCYKAGIDVVMMTGDNINTAKEIAIQAGFKAPWAIEAKDFDAVAWGDPTCGYPNVIARCKPEDKLYILKKFQKAGYICAMTGDGCNDSSSLNHANVGLAMGSGTNVAKEASDIVLLDDAFPSIVKGIKWGRSLYKNIQSFLLFQLTINVSLCLTALFAPLFGCETPFSVIEILYINLVMDALGALCLASEPALDSVLNEKPRNKKEFIINKPMLINIGITGVLIFISMIGCIIREWNTMLFALFMTIGWMNLFRARVFGKQLSMFTSLSRNKLFLLISSLILICNISIVQFGGNIFGTSPLTINEWLQIFTASILVLVISQSLSRAFTK